MEAIAALRTQGLGDGFSREGTERKPASPRERRDDRGRTTALRGLRNLRERCKEPVGEEALRGVRFPFGRAPDGGLGFHKAVGCGRCAGSGYKGRAGPYELMAVGEGARSLALRRAPAGEIGRAAEREGMARLREDGLLEAAGG